jgi:hypothetical protein
MSNSHLPASPPRWAPAEEALLRRRWGAIRLASADVETALASAAALLKAAFNTARGREAVRERVGMLGMFLTVFCVRLGRKDRAGVNTATRLARVLARGPRSAKELAERTNRGWHATLVWREADRRRSRRGALS